MSATPVGAPLLLLPLALALASCAPAPLFATHTCGDPSHVVQMPLTCIERPDAVSAHPDHAAAIARTLSVLAARSPGRAGETMVALAHEYDRIDGALHADYAAACRAWTTPCDRAQQAVYEAGRDQRASRDAHLAPLHATLDQLAAAGGRIELTDDAAKRALAQLEATAEAMRAP